MIITGARAVSRRLLVGPILLNNTRHGRCKSTKSAIHAGLNDSRSPNVGGRDHPFRPRKLRRSNQDATWSDKHDRREGLSRNTRAPAYNSRPERGPEHSPHAGVYGRPYSLHQQNVTQNPSSASKTPGPLRTTRSGRRDPKAFALDGEEKLPAHSSKLGTRSNQRYSPAERGAIEKPSGDGRRRIPRFSEAQKSTDRVEDERYVGRGKTDYQYEGPLQLPYTTPASEFLYGHNVVTAALQANRRKLYKLYIYQSPAREEQGRDMDLRKLALERGVQVERISQDNVRLLDKMSEGRPHNGFVLEASPLPKLPVTGFGQLVRPHNNFLAILDHQSREAEEVNGTDPRIKYNPAFLRFPFVVLLDGVVDPQNLGAIIRSAFFLGVDAIALSVNRSAPLSPAALKASAGASESMPIVTVDRVRPFLEKCKRNDWKVYASSAEPPWNRMRKGQRHTHFTTSRLVSDVTKRPCILILGSEGQGLYKDVQGAANSTIAIEGYRQGQLGIDSLNVSVAAGLLCEAFLRKPRTINKEFKAYSDRDGLDPGPEDRLF